MDTLENTITFYHGGVEPDFNINSLDVFRRSEKQQNSNNSYVGFYMYDENNYDSAEKYAKQENKLKKTNIKGVVSITMPIDINVYMLPPFTITRITLEQLKHFKELGYDVIAGRMLGKIEYVLVNKDKIIDMQFIPIEMENIVGKYCK